MSDTLTTIATICNSLPEGAEVVLTDDRGQHFCCATVGTPTYDPDGGRRMLCSTTGGKWDITTSFLVSMEIVSMFMPSQTLDGTPHAMRVVPRGS